MRLEALISRKQGFVDQLAQMLADIELEETEIAALEQGLRPRRTAARRRPTPTDAEMISAQLRRTVRILYGFSCGYCGVTEAEVGAYLTTDHYQSKDAGGTGADANRVYACHTCNLHISTTWDPLNPAVLHPLRTEMSLHVRLLPDGNLQCLTAEGIRHVQALHLDRAPMVERRKMRLLVAAMFGREAELRAKEKQLDQEIQQKKRAIRRKRAQNEICS